MTISDAIEKVDCLVGARWVIPVEPAGAVLEHHSVAVRDGRIVAVLPNAVADRRFQPEERVSLPDHVLIPGLISLHAHAGLALLRGRTGSIGILPASATIAGSNALRHLTADFVRASTLIACAEMLRGGITCFNEMGYFPESVAEAARESGMRAAVGIPVTDVPTPYAADAEDYLTRGLATRDALREQPLLSFCLSPIAPGAIGDRSFAELVTVAGEIDIPLHLHLHETESAVTEHVARFGVRPIARLAALGVFGERMIAVGTVGATDAEFDTVARFGCSVAFCPSTNPAAESSGTQLSKIINRGINFGLGTETGPCAYRHDLFQEMRLASCIANAGNTDLHNLPPSAALCAATINAAQALGIDREAGSFLPGKSADLCAVSLANPGTMPCHDPHWSVVHAAAPDSVTDVWVAGRRLVANGSLMSIDSGRLDNLARLWQHNLTG